MSLHFGVCLSVGLSICVRQPHARVKHCHSRLSTALNDESHEYKAARMQTCQTKCDEQPSNRPGNSRSGTLERKKQSPTMYKANMPKRPGRISRMSELDAKDNQWPASGIGWG
jgi:hypothetical protein